MGEAGLLALAERVEKFDCNITCPLCGETDFDVPGFVFSHSNWCEVQRACCEVMANNDAEVAARLRERAALSPTPPGDRSL